MLVYYEYYLVVISLLLIHLHIVLFIDYSILHDRYYVLINNYCIYTYWIVFSYYFTYLGLLKRGVRIALRSKVNDSLISGLRIVDSILPVGRGQRQLLLGDRY